MPEVRCGIRRDVDACLERVRIVGGNEADCNEWPWQVGLFRRGEWGTSSIPFCGGALINSNHVVTAARCIGRKTVADIAVTIGDHVSKFTVTEPEQVWVDVKEIIEHFGYDERNMRNDIAVLRLAQQVDLSLFSPVCIPPASVASAEEFAGQMATATGWGDPDYDYWYDRRTLRDLTASLDWYPGFEAYNPGFDPDTLEELDLYTLQELQDVLPIVRKADCVNEYIHEDDLWPGMFCAGGPDLEFNTCMGDSGGPLTRQTSTGVYELVGTVSWGTYCANSFGVYADLPYYRQWLVENVGTVYTA